jgi:hypothetical protein
MNLQTKLPLGNNLLGLGLLLFMFILIVLRFNGVPDQYATQFWFYDDPGRYPFDMYMNNNFFFKTSFFYDINKYLGLHRNDLLSLAFYIITAWVGIWFLYRIIERHFGVGQRLLVLMIVLFVCFQGRDIPANSWAGVIPLQPGTFTMFAKGLSFIALFYMLENRIWLSSALISVVVSIHMLGDFIMPIILFFFILLNKETPKKNIAVLILPAAVVIWKKFAGGIEMPPVTEYPTMYEAIMVSGPQDDDFLYQKKLAMLLFAVSFLIFPFMWRQLGTRASSSMANLLKATYGASLCVAVFATFYTAYGYKLFLYPPLMLLGPVRAMSFYSLFFFLTAFVLVVQSSRFTTIEKASLVIALIWLHGESPNGIIYPVILLIAGFTASRLVSGKLEILNSTRGFTLMTTCLLVLLMGAQIVRGGVYFTEFNTQGWHYLKRWTRTITADPSVWKTFSGIGTTQKDFIMLPLYRDNGGKLMSSPFLNILAEKSSFVSTGHQLFFEPDLWREHLERKKIYEKIVTAVEDKNPLSQDTIEFLRTRDVSIILPVDDANALTGWQKKTVVDDFLLFNFRRQLE